MKLYNLKRNSLFKIDGSDTIYKFFHVDGMYSYCKTMEGNVIHIAAYTDVNCVGQFEENNEDN